MKTMNYEDYCPGGHEGHLLGVGDDGDAHWSGYCLLVV